MNVVVSVVLQETNQNSSIYNHAKRDNERAIPKVQRHTKFGEFRITTAFKTYGVKSK